MNHTKYRVCLLVLLVAAVAAGILLYVYGGEKEEPYMGGTLVERSVRPVEGGMAEEAGQPAGIAGETLPESWKEWRV